ncbi:MAG: FAD-binding oxidoreductase [Mesorhizobium sp.]|uniref:NAD(P)/FAD-dependent oxidoreductase n=1 Tax=Mesorhizobium sp. TaxID=1871066 RepID=UPI000FE93DF6|nr:FAD-binding oxidoreductase [Mesorhizobium sp.]RWD49585.1 MAG: FAD-binding oxidoreductase [Mesorhizobium sp.]RWE58656.1 MAG: FAD-binding oxidoreductase [Mesorhizobium sp.]RWF09057.1 MAG: FAD-binding oxidoreductase [Mesorhizobium sp.]RWF16406.1 MAG: FAD-binding oxidoreductase [Mesorhizobium sp.]
MLNDQRSHGLWERTAPPAPETEKLRDDLVADVAIVGAGYTGLSTALHLAERGLDAIVLEAADIGFGAAGRSTGLVNAGLWVMPSALKETLGPVYGGRLLDLLRDSPRTVFEIVDKHNLQCEPKRVGTIHCGADKKGVAEIAERARQWQALGAPVHILNAGETRAKTGTSAFRAGLLDLRAGTIQPLAYARGLAGAAIAAGATIFTASPVEHIAREGGVWRLATQGGSVRAKWAVLSTDTYTAHILPELRGEQVVLPFFHVATAPLNHSIRRTILPEGQGAWDTRTVLTAFRTDNAGRLIVGSVGALRGTGTVIHRNWARRRIRALFPQIGDVELEHEWYGRIGMTKDHLPRLHSPAENMIALTGFNGRGIAPGTVFGRELARHMAGELPLDGMFLPVSLAQNARFRAVREGYYEFGAQIAHLPPAH